MIQIKNESKNALCAGDHTRSDAVVYFQGNASHRVFDTVFPEPDYIEADPKQSRNESLE